MEDLCLAPLTISRTCYGRKPINLHLNISSSLFWEEFWLHQQEFYPIKSVRLIIVLNLRRTKHKGIFLAKQYRGKDKRAFWDWFLWTVASLEISWGIYLSKPQAVIYCRLSLEASVLNQHVSDTAGVQGCKRNAWKIQASISLSSNLDSSMPVIKMKFHLRCFNFHGS